MAKSTTPPAQRVYSTQEVAARLGCSEVTVRRLLKDPGNPLTARRSNGKQGGKGVPWRFSEQTLVAYEDWLTEGDPSLKALAPEGI